MKDTAQNTEQLALLMAEAKNHEVACIMLSNGFEDRYGRYEVLAGFGAAEETTDFNHSGLDRGLWMGFCSYELKNRFWQLTSANPAGVSVPDFYFFRPVLYYRKPRNGDAESNFSLNREPAAECAAMPELEFRCATDRETYIRNIEDIRECIAGGDFYEMNYCLEFRADAEADPYGLFLRLNRVAPSPFSVFFKYHDRYLLCSSPERFLTRTGSKIVSQPIKGTRKRMADSGQDTDVKIQLQTSEKDRAENIMIVDLVRNDLSHVCVPGTVHVDELCGIYSFSHVHQMISTVSGILNPDTGFGDILKATFPMGSMTGAPKLQVMKDVERFENFSRGWYSGSVGYLENGDFDLNVVIRSLQTVKGKECLYYHVGGAITYDSLADEEYSECLAKASGIMAAVRA